MRILVVEDEKGIAEAIQAILENHRYEVDLVLMVSLHWIIY